jgi:hypothetical protein
MGSDRRQAWTDGFSSIATGNLFFLSKRHAHWNILYSFYLNYKVERLFMRKYNIVSKNGGVDAVCLGHKACAQSIRGICVIRGSMDCWI